MQEQEYKLLLTAEQYRDAADALTHSASRENPYIQINYYFDTEDFELYKSGRTLRVREKDSRLQLQYKSANQGAGDLYEREEKSIPLLELPSQLIPAHYFPNISAAIDCRYIGSL